jgi:hypothetical protein
MGPVEHSRVSNEPLILPTPSAASTLRIGVATVARPWKVPHSGECSYKFGRRILATLAREQATVRIGADL